MFAYLYPQKTPKDRGEDKKTSGDLFLVCFWWTAFSLCALRGCVCLVCWCALFVDVSFRGVLLVEVSFLCVLFVDAFVLFCLFVGVLFVDVSFRDVLLVDESFRGVLSTWVSLLVVCSVRG